MYVGADRLDTIADKLLVKYIWALPDILSRVISQLLHKTLGNKFEVKDWHILKGEKLKKKLMR